MGLFRFLVLNLSHSGRLHLYRDFTERGKREAEKLGIKIPLSLSPDDLSEVFYEHIYDRTGYIPGETDTVVDVGAYVGDFSVYCSKVLKVAKVIAFEPVQDNLKLAQDFAQLNSCNNIEFYGVALSDIEGTGTIDQRERMAGSFSTGGESHPVTYRPLDWFNASCDLLKIDVEGFEVKVLRGARKTIERCRPRIILEVHSSKLKQECLRSLDEMGYFLEIQGEVVANPQKGFDAIQNLFFRSK